MSTKKSITLFRISLSIPKNIIHDTIPESNGEITHDAAKNK